MHRRLPLLAAIPVLLLLVLPATASAKVPSVFGSWAPPYSNWSVKPSGIGGTTGDGSARLGNDPGGNGAISWRRWTSKGAVGVGKYWIDDCIPDTAEGTFHGHQARIHLFRVRHGHYTRMTVRWHGGHKFWDAGTILHVDHYHLTHWGGGLFWGRGAASTGDLPANRH